FTEADVNSVSFILNRGESLSRCSQCKTARYCSVQCQKQAWPDHKRECKCLKHLQPRIPTDSVRLLTRTIFKLLSQSESDQEELYSIAEHQSHTEMCVLWTFFHVFTQVTCNCFSISDGELQDVGVGLYLSMSLLNQDCQPNCVMIFEGKRLTLRAVRLIRPCEELTISYTDILEQYHFLCQCTRCTTEDKVSHSNSLSYLNFLPLSSFFYSSHFHPITPGKGFSPPRCVLAGSLSIIPVLLHVLSSSLFCSVSVPLSPRKLYYSDPHPSRAVELLWVGKMQHYMGRLEEAQGSFTQAYDIMKVTHGTDHVLTNEVKRKLSECQAELGQV
uniref:[histone H3]-lysine(4) N-trimethyltransferase n=1 Tax=Sinocyclocheilus grahami TaxID=75366 RepID=A0A672PFW5_SINGR